LLCSIDDDTFLETTNVGFSFSLAYVDEENGYEEEKDERELEVDEYGEGIIEAAKVGGGRSSNYTVDDRMSCFARLGLKLAWIQRLARIKLKIHIG
jgi:hypothetical protein